MYLSAYVNPAQMIIHKGKFIPGNVTAFYGREKHGSGIGDTRADSTALSKKITAYIKINHNDVSKQIYQYVSVQTDDLLRDIATFFQ